MNDRLKIIEDLIRELLRDHGRRSDRRTFDRREYSSMTSDRRKDDRRRL